MGASTSSLQCSELSRHVPRHQLCVKSLNAQYYCNCLVPLQSKTQGKGKKVQIAQCRVQTTRVQTTRGCSHDHKSNAQPVDQCGGGLGSGRGRRWGALGGPFSRDATCLRPSANKLRESHADLNVTLWSIDLKATLNWDSFVPFKAKSPSVPNITRNAVL